MSNFQIGVNPLTWLVSDFPEIGSDIPLEQCLTEASDAGFAGIELAHKFPREPKILQELLNRYQLKLISGSYGAHLLRRSAKAEIHAMQSHVQLLQELGCEVLIFAETSNSIHANREAKISKRPICTHNEMLTYCENLTQIGDYLSMFGIKLAYHHHMGTIIETQADIEFMLDHTGPSVNLAFDTGHMAFAGVDYQPLLEKYCHRVAHFHCKDIRAHILQTARSANWTFHKSVVSGVFTMPGEGVIDFGHLFSILRDNNYSGWVVAAAEQDISKVNTKEVAQKSYQYLNKTIAATMATNVLAEIEAID